VTVQVATPGDRPSLAPDTPVLHVAVGGFGSFTGNTSFNWSALDSGNWSTLTWNFTVPSPLPSASVTLSLQFPRITLTIASVTLRAAPV
jgi:hypothetical protein